MFTYIFINFQILSFLFFFNFSALSFEKSYKPETEAVEGKPNTNIQIIPANPKP